MAKVGLSRRAMRSVDVDAGAVDGALPDRREADIQALTTIDQELFSTLGDVFAGTELMADQRKVKLLLKLRAEVSVAWSQTRDAFIEIGRALNDIDRHLDEQERDRLRRGFTRIFPFSDTVASQFRVIARAVDEGALPRELIPGSYGTAYQMALLSRDEIEVARSKGLLRPDVPRRVLIEFRRENHSVQMRGGRRIDPERMKSELARLERIEQQQAATLDATRSRIAELRSLLAMKES